MTSESPTTADNDKPLESQEPPPPQEEPANSTATDQESQEIDIEGTEDSVDSDIPMELTTPLSSGSELNLSFESELVEEKDHQDKITTSSEVATIKKDDETMDVDVVGEEAGNSSSTPHAERKDSVKIDPSFEPESEELLYEGDVEHDGEENKTVPQDGQPSAPAASATTATHEEGFVLAVDDTFADLDVAPSGKSSPKKQESSSKLKSESKSSSKSQSTSSSQSSKVKTEGGSSSSTTLSTTATNGSSKHSTKDSGKSTSSGSSESAAASRFV